MLGFCQARSEWEWFGNAAHFICASDCQFHMATLVGPWIVSTVGQYLPDSAVREILAESRGIALEGRGDYRRASWMKQAGFEEIGCGRTFETMVFRAGERCSAEDCGCGLPSLDPPSELDSDAYNDAGSATRGHYAMCEKWSRIDPSDHERVENAAVKPPEERLEFLRFFVIEGDANFKHHLSEWMQEVERQLEALRKRLNDLPSEYARKGPVW